MKWKRKRDPLERVMDKVAKTATCRRGERTGTRVTECKRGHAYTPENTYTNPQGYRVCRACKRERAAA